MIKNEKLFEFDEEGCYVWNSEIEAWVDCFGKVVFPQPSPPPEKDE